MDDKNNKLEDFFNQSLNQFDDSPSDAVWENLQERLDSERTFLEVWTSAIRKYFPYLLLLLGLGTYHIFSQNKINRLTNHMFTIEAEKSALGLELTECSNRTSTLLTDLNNQNDQLQQNEANQLFFEEKIKSSNAQIAQLQLINSRSAIYNSHAAGDYPSVYKLNHQVVSEATAFNSIFNTVDQEVKDNGKAKIQSSANEAALTNFPAQIQSPLLPSLFSKKTKKIFPADYNLIKNGFKHGIQIDLSEENEKTKFRIGYQYSAFRTHTNPSKFNFGQAHGFRAELVFKNQMALTGGIHFIQQKYTITNFGNPIPAADLLKYPGGNSFGDQVISVRVKNNYFSLPLGLKWTVKKWKNDLDIFVNPALVWQIYLPQNFDYTLNTSTTIDRRNKQLFGYFGSGNLQIGLEKTLKNNMTWQLGIWGEKSFVPLGIESQNILMSGIYTAILL